jgi:hypothetical protein
MIIELMKYAPDFIKNIAKEKAPNAKAYAMFRMYDHHLQKYPNLRDRTEEMIPAVMGLAGKTGYWTSNTIIFNGTGYDLFEYGYKVYGADYIANFRIVFA